jgi:hypothetical protein
MVRNGHDYMAHFAQGAENRNYNPYEGFGFFATPMTLARMMAEMTFSGADHERAKRESVCDPCCGTGTLLLAASNYSLNLYGQDLSLSMVRMCRLNGWLYAPWMVFWPDFSILFGPTKEQMKEALFGSVGVGVTPDPDVVPARPADRNVMVGELKETETGQYIMPLFEENA